MAGAGIFLVGLAAQAQENSRLAATPSMRVHGQATVSVAPDQAQLDIGVVTEASTAQATSDLNAERSRTLIEQLRALVPPANMKNINFSVNPNYRYPSQGVPVIAGSSSQPPNALLSRSWLRRKKGNW